mmetsp:Transcript_125276/g.220633  ORF Transcript_125276/g.220633 Transcript_125276/m.220633 type:complete len:201 (-) Transcript_125276:1652-2254(-)
MHISLTKYDRLLHVLVMTGLGCFGQAPFSEVLHTKLPQATITVIVDELRTFVLRHLPHTTLVLLLGFPILETWGLGHASAQRNVCRLVQALADGRFRARVRIHNHLSRLQDNGLRNLREKLPAIRLAVKSHSPHSITAEAKAVHTGELSLCERPQIRLNLQTIQVWSQHRGTSRVIRCLLDASIGCNTPIGKRHRSWALL